MSSGVFEAKDLKQKNILFWKLGSILFKLS